MPKQRARSSHQNHGRSRAFREERFPQVTKHFSCRKPVRTATAAQPAESDSDDDFVPLTEAQLKLRQKRAAAIALENEKKAEKEEKKVNARKKKEEKEEEKWNKPQKKLKKKVEKPNITEDEAAWQGLTFRKERAVDNQLTTFVWGVYGPELIVIPEGASTQPMPEMDEERIAFQFFDTPRRLQLFAM
jgi:DNA-directed RNA polymerase subunit M/transcription elongation factor TFIIS